MINSTGWRLLGTTRKLVPFIIITLGCLVGPRSVQATGWEPAGFGAAGNFLGVYFHPSQPGVVYAASDVGGVFYSGDSGDNWEMRNGGLGNHEISAFAFDPFNANRLYVGAGAIPVSAKAGIYVSDDAGLTWRHLPATYTNGITFRKYRTGRVIAPDPDSTGVIVTGSRSRGLWRSPDAGTTWVQVYTPPLTDVVRFNDGAVEDDPPETTYDPPTSAVMFDPENSNIIYAGFDGFGVVKSTSRGTAGSWQTATSGLPTKATVKDLAVHGAVVYAALGIAGVYRSVDSGATWQSRNGELPLGNGYDEPWITSVALDPSDPDIAYVTVATYDFANVWKTTDGGASWQPTGQVTYDVVNDPTESWSTGPTLTWRVTVNPHDPSQLFYCHYWDIFRSDNAGDSWTAKIVGAQNTCVTAIIVDTLHAPEELDILYATHMDAGLLVSTDLGTTWQMVVPPTGEYSDTLAGHYWRVAIATIDASRYFYITSDPWSTNYGQVLRSTDAVNWERVLQLTRPTGEWMDGAMVGLAVDPVDPSIVYITQDGGQVYKSTASGAAGTWQATTAQPVGRSFTYALAVDYGQRVFAGTISDGLYRSTNGGTSWERVLTGVFTVHGLLTVPGAVYATCGDANLYRSTNGGDDWERLTDYIGILDGDGVGPEGRAVAVNPADPNQIFYSRTDNWHPADRGLGVVNSTDGGQNWSDGNDGLGHVNVSALAVSGEGYVFAGTWCGGIWRRPLSSFSSVTLAQESPTPGTFTLEQNYPNPFNGNTTIRFTLDMAEKVEFRLVDILGRTVLQRDLGPLVPGSYILSWDGESGSGRALPSGVYFYQLRAGGRSETRKMVLLK